MTDLFDWLTREAAALPSVAAVLRALCENLTAAGLPVARATTHIRTLHPEVRGVTQLWRRGIEVEELMALHGIETSSTFVGSPVQHVMATQEWIDRRLDDDAVARFPMFAELRDEGITHYVMAPMVFSSGTVNAASWATDAPGGFTEAQVALLHRLQPVYNLVLELKAIRRIAARLLSVYVGDEPGERILNGAIRRGDTRPIRAAMLSIDMRNFTRYSVALPGDQVAWLLNEFFDAVVPSVLDHQGEVLKFIGDGVLAVFPDAVCSARQACARALGAAREMLARVPLANSHELRAGVALHYGEAVYGNVGAATRLDFTVIGRDVNLLARIERLCGPLGRTLLVSERFAGLVEEPAEPLGYYPLKGFDEPQAIFALA